MSRHLAIYLPSLRGGGAERVSLMLAKAFSERGFRVDLVLAKAEGAYLEEVPDEIRVIDLGQRRVLSSLLPLANYLRRERPDAILSALNHANIVAILARRLAGSKARLVVSEHNSLAAFVNMRVRVVRSLMTWLYPKADRVVCVSRGMEQELATMLGIPAHKLVTVYNPLDIDNIRHRMALRPEHPWLEEGEPPLLVAVGRLSKQKDYPTLLRAFALLRSSRPVHLAILGQGPDLEKLKSLADELGIARDVQFLGFQRNPFGWMAAGDLYVMSSAWEGLPGTLLEAIVCGAKIVSTDCRTGPDEILEQGKWGRLVPVADALSLSRSMAAALDEQAHPNLSERAEDFSIDRAVAGYSRAFGFTSSKHDGS